MSDDRDAERQRVVRVPGRRRAKLTPVSGSTGEPVPADEKATDAAAPGSRDGRDAASGPNDERLKRDIPPHY